MSGQGNPITPQMSAGEILRRLTASATLAAGALLYGAGSATLSTLALGTAGRVLVAGASAPAWSDAGLSYASGVLAIAGSAPAATVAGNVLIGGGAIRVAGSTYLEGLTFLGATGGKRIEFTPASGVVEFYDRGVSAYFAARYIAASHSFEGGGISCTALTASAATGAFQQGSQPIGGEDVSAWVNKASSVSVARGFQSYITHSGTGGSTAYDAVASTSATAGHNVCYQGVSKATGAATPSYLSFAYGSGDSTSSGTIANAYGYYWGGWTGAGTITNKWAFFNAATDKSYFGGDVYYNSKFAVGVSTATALSWSLTINNPTTPLIAMQRADADFAYITNAATVLSGKPATDLAIVHASTGAVWLGGDGVGMLKVDGTAVTIAGPTSCTKLTASGTITSSGASPIVALDRSASGNACQILLRDSTNTRYNWLFGVQYNTDDGWEITPSTAVGGSTFSTPCIRGKVDGVGVKIGFLGAAAIARPTAAAAATDPATTQTLANSLRTILIDLGLAS